MQIRIKALNVKKGALQKLGFYLGTFSKHVLVSQLGLLLSKYHTAVRAYIPLADVAVKCATVEHIDHVSHVGHVPLADVAIEVAFIEHPVHVSHVGHVPLADVASKFAAREHTAHVSHVGHVPLADVAIEY